MKIFGSFTREESKFGSGGGVTSFEAPEISDEPDLWWTLIEIVTFFYLTYDTFDTLIEGIFIYRVQ